MADWTDRENDQIVSDYFAMLAADLSGDAYIKAKHNRALQTVISRSKKSIEFKHQNISAVLMGLGETWIPGYRPAANFQAALEDAVARWLAANPEWLKRSPPVRPELAEAAALWIGPPPAQRNAPPPAELAQMTAIARRFDVADRDDRNRTLGAAGEARVLAHEQVTLASAGRQDLAKRVRWVAHEDGDGAGYDIASFEADGRDRLIEVKTTNGWERTPFFISRNELAVATARREDWCLVRLWDFARNPQAFEIRSPLEEHVALTPMNLSGKFALTAQQLIPHGRP